MPDTNPQPRALDVVGEAVEAYEYAVERARLARQGWEDAGRPLLATGSKGQQVAHPLLKVIR